MRKLSDFKPNPKNPRIIKDDKFKKLVKSIQDFPEMMSKRKLICVTDVDGKLYPLGGNMRLRALQELKYKEIQDDWYDLADEWTEEQRKEFLIKDNVGFGEWDWDSLANEWDSDELEDWGLDVPNFGGDFQKGKISKENIKPFIQTHVLISFPPEKMIYIQEFLEQITKIEGLEYEQSSN